MLMYVFAFTPAHSQPNFVNKPPVNNYVPPGGYDTDIVTGAQRVNEYMPLLKNKKIAVVANQTSLIDNTHLVDSLVAYGVPVVKVFTLEHGFRGNAAAGETIASVTDEKTGLPLVSLYGKNKKPTAEALKDIDVIVFDIQDVGARFYTYISSLHYIMQAAAENKKEVWVLDRPNPNGFYVDGPVLQPGYTSFIGMHKIPVVHGMTIGEYAQMLNGEQWLGTGVSCRLKVITCSGYTHKSLYKLPVAPSPNLQTMEAIYAYPSLCLLEATSVSVGRGTAYPFLFYGMPGMKGGDTTLTPVAGPIAKKPPHENNACRGYRLTKNEIDDIVLNRSLNINWLLNAYAQCANKALFIPPKGNFNFLAGNNTLAVMVKKNKKNTEISASWKKEVEQFKLTRKKYLLYEDFE